jgi:hypothetical protein
MNDAGLASQMTPCTWQEAKFLSHERHTIDALGYRYFCTAREERKMEPSTLLAALDKPPAQFLVNKWRFDGSAFMWNPFIVD